MEYKSRTCSITRREFLKFLGVSSTALAIFGCSDTRVTSPVDPQPSTPEPTTPPTSTASPTIEPVYPEMVRVEAGMFQMGSQAGHFFEQPVHQVRLSRGFSIGINPVTFAEYDRFCLDTGMTLLVNENQDRETLPVTGLNWIEAVAYCSWLNEKAGIENCYTGRGKVTKCDFAAGGYRLPTEAEWEYAARGGHRGQGYIYSGSDNPDEVGWYVENSGGDPHPVGQKKPNELGIYDMSGNTWEWCWDWFDSGYYSISPSHDPLGPEEIPSGPFVQRSRRSGSSAEAATTLRTAYRSADEMTYSGANGFRLVKSV